MTQYIHKLALLGTCAVAFSLPVSVAHADTEADQLQSLVAKQSPSIVSVRVVLKMDYKARGQAQNQEQRSDQQGVIVDSSGIVMLTNFTFSSDRILESMGMTPDEATAQGLSLNITPTDFKVIFDHEEKEYSAYLAATDKTLGLAFLKIDDLAGRTVTPLSFANSSTPTVGQELVVLSRLSKGYDYAPFFETGRVQAILTKPRTAFKLDDNISEIGLPIFTLAGDPVGMMTSVSSGVSEGRKSGIGLFAVPGSAVNGVITQAIARAATVAADRAKAKAAAPTVTPAPTTTAPAPKAAPATPKP